MVGATLPAAPSVRKQKSIAFSMLFGRTIAYASSPPDKKPYSTLFGRTIVTLAVLPRVEGSLRSVRSLRSLGSPVSGVWSPYGTEDGGSGATGRVEPTG